MSKDPVRLKSGRLGCPSCRYPLVPGRTPFYHDGDKLGAFDGIVCELCGYGRLTKKGRVEADKATRSFGSAKTLCEVPLIVDDVYVINTNDALQAASQDLNKTDAMSTTHNKIPAPPLTVSCKVVRSAMRFA